jgi:predicted phosphodiesterase
MIFAAIGDIAGDLPALEAAIHAIDEAGLLTLLHTGNSVAGGPSGAAILERLRARGVVCVASASDRATARFQKMQGTLERKLDPEEFEALRAAHEALPSAALEYLAAVPRETRLTLEGLEVVLCHGALGSKRDIITAKSPLKNLEREREIAPVELIVTGGAPAPFHRVVGDTHFVCPGPLRASAHTIRYARINTEDRPYTVDFPEAPLLPLEPLR